MPDALYVTGTGAGAAPRSWPCRGLAPRGCRAEAGARLTLRAFAVLCRSRTQT